MRALRAAAAATLVACAAPAQPGVAGDWAISPGARGVGSVTLAIMNWTGTRGNSISARQVEARRLEGLARPPVADGPARFRLVRDAGTFAFTGTFAGGKGSGRFAFVPEASFAAELARREIGRPTPAEQFSMALHEIGLDFVRELERQGYRRPTAAELVRAGTSGARLEYLAALGALGYRAGSLAALVRMRDHGVRPEFVRGLAELGYRELAAEELVRLRDHGVTLELVRALREMGYAATPAELVRLRDHGVTAEFARRANGRAGSRLPVAELIRLRDRGGS